MRKKFLAHKIIRTTTISKIPTISGFLTRCRILPQLTNPGCHCVYSGLRLPMAFVIFRGYLGAHRPDELVGRVGDDAEIFEPFLADGALLILLMLADDRLKVTMTSLSLRRILIALQDASVSGW